MSRANIRDRYIEDLKECFANTKNYLKVAHINVNGLMCLSRIQDIKVLIEATQIDILGITETKLSSKIGDEDIEIEGYKTFRRDRSRNDGGGCLMYYKENLDVTGIELHAEGKGEAETIWADLKMHSQNIAIAVMYRPPDDRGFYQEFERQVEIVREKRNHLFIMGDLNSDLVKKKDGDGKKLKSAMSGYNLKNVIKKATRVTETTETLIDVILVNNEEKIMKSGVMDTGIADHRMIYALVKVTRPKIAPKIKFVIDWKKFNADKFKQDLKMAPWHSCNVFEEVDDNLWTVAAGAKILRWGKPKTVSLHG